MGNNSILKSLHKLHLELFQAKRVRFTAALSEFELFGNSD
jgi:hypothetical protein